MKCKQLIPGIIIFGLISAVVILCADNVTSFDAPRMKNKVHANSADAETWDNNINGFEIVKPVSEVVPFGVGEKLVFGLQYGLVSAGKATLEIRNIAVLDSIKSYHIFSLAKSNKAFDLIFKVRDRHESFMDYENLYSLKFKKHLREGNFRRDEIVIFDQINHLAIYKDEKKRIPPNTHDFLTAFYYIRTVPLIPGQAVFLANNSGKKNYPIYVKVLRREKISVPAGDFDCIVIEPVLRTSKVSVSGS